MSALMRSSSRKTILPGTPRAATAEQFDSDDEAQVSCEESSSNDPLTQFRTPTIPDEKLGYRAVPRATNQMVIEYQHGKWLPCWHSDLADPFTTLRYFYDAHEQKLRQRFLRTLQNESVLYNEAGDDAAASKAKKRFTLRRKGKKVAPVGPDAELLAAAEQKEVEAYALKLVLVREHIATIITKLDQRSDAFTNALCDLAQIGNKQLRHEIAVLVTYAMLDSTVAQHQFFEGLNLCDNALFRKIGESAVTSYICAMTLLQGNGPDVAQSRFLRVVEGTHVWLTEKLSDGARTVLPIFWALEPKTCEPLNKVDMKEHEMRVMSSVPFIMIGILELMRLSTERDIILKNLITTFV